MQDVFSAPIGDGNAVTVVNPSSNDNFVLISNLFSAGIGETDDGRTFYCRDDFRMLASFVDRMVAGNHLGLVDGLPGTGKSSTIWWTLQQPKHRDAEVAWLHLDRSGLVSSFVKKERGGKIAEQPLVGLTEIEGISADILVIDGVSHEVFGMLLGTLRRWALCVEKWLLDYI